MNYFVTAIGTDCGKTLSSAILCEALHADYWKPVQSGPPSDTETVRSLISNQVTAFHPEQYVLKTPVSPHAAARIDGVSLKVSSFRIPQTSNTLVIEGAGGCLVPINDEEFIVDLIDAFKAEVILVSNLYLGSINHTLLTLEALQRRHLTIKGLIFNGDSNPESERIILHHAKAKCLMRIRRESVIDREVVKKYASLLKAEWNG